MNPDRQSQLLVHWLQQDAGTAPPADLDPDAIEAVYCLRPDLAPPPRVDIESILAEVHQGPLAVRPAHAPAIAALVSWLAENPGAAPPEDIDDDVLEAVFALRPDLAPPPRVALDDILGAVTTGPFAAAVPVRRQARAPETQRPRSAPAARRPAPALRSRRIATWVIPAMGGLAVAATALLFVLPRAQPVMDAASPLSTRQGAGAVVPKLAPAAAPEPEPADRSRAHELLEGQGQGQGQGKILLGAIPPQSPHLAKKSPALPDDDAFAPAEAAPMPTAVGTTTGAGIGALAPASDPATRGGAMLDSETLANQSEAAKSPARKNKSAERSAKRSGRGEGLFGGGSSRIQEAAGPETVSPDLTEALAVGSGVNAGLSADLSADEADAAMPEPSLGQAALGNSTSSPAPSTSASASASAEGIQLRIDQLRTAAWPVGGFPDMTLAGPDVAAAHAAASDADARGDQAGFLSALLPLLDHADPDVAADAAFRIARRQTALGQHTAALQTIDRALGLGASSLQDARLHALAGQIYERLGDPARAAAAYRKAITER